MTIKLNNQSLGEFLEMIGVEPSPRTRSLMEADPDQTIENFCGAQTAIAMGLGGSLRVGELGAMPVGYMRSQSVEADMAGHGFRKVGSGAPDNERFYRKLLDQYGENNILPVGDLTISGIRTFLGRPYKGTKLVNYFLMPTDSVQTQEGPTLELPNPPSS